MMAAAHAMMAQNPVQVRTRKAMSTAEMNMLVLRGSLENSCLKPVISTASEASRVLMTK